MAYTSATLVQQKTGNTLTVDEVSLLDAIIAPAITDWINNYIGATYDDTNGVVTVHRNGGSAAVYVGPLATITRVEYVDPDTAVNGGDLFAVTDYYKEGDYIFTYTGKPFNKGVRNIRITGTYMDIPPAITLAATIMAAKAVQYKGANLISSEKIGDYQVSYSDISAQKGVADFVDATVMQLLAPYKPLRLA